MAYRVKVCVSEACAALTATDWLSNRPCVNIATGEEIKEVEIAAPTTFEIAVGIRDGAGRVDIHDPAHGTSKYNIPRELDASGKITFPKDGAVSPKDLDKLAKGVEELREEVAALREEVAALK